MLTFAPKPCPPSETPKSHSLIASCWTRRGRLEVTRWKTLAEPGEYNGQTASRETWTSTLHQWPNTWPSRSGTLYLQSWSPHFHYLPPWSTFPQNQKVIMHKGVQRTPRTYLGLYITILYQDEWKQVLDRESPVWLIVEMVQPTAGCDNRVRQNWSQAYC